MPHWKPNDDTSTGSKNEKIQNKGSSNKTGS